MDLVQEALTLYFEKAPEEVRENEAKTFVWIYHTSIYLHKNNLRRKKNSVSLDNLYANGKDLKSTEELEKDIITVETIEKILMSLSKADSILVKRKYIEGYSLEEIAKEIGSNVKATQKRLERAMKKAKSWGGGISMSLFSL